ncbi:uncharacterized protein LOC124945454 [Impatiens glandulifera]|uniref:uncharacterized protein LOC124945454 n=1 Tax=Impatiens glandulifera TaxID=253017 RepID=UPI001FB18AAA|nr:uncharacterized protein LOC124945454 [Impatiens glandulifera]
MECRRQWEAVLKENMEFIIWLAFWKRLNNPDRISMYMNIPDVSCLICNENEETIDHLFGSCSIALENWDKFSRSLELIIFPKEWKEIKEATLIKAKGNKFATNVFKCGFEAVVYNILQECNARVYERTRRSVEELWRDIVSDFGAIA